MKGRQGPRDSGLDFSGRLPERAPPGKSIAEMHTSDPEVVIIGGGLAGASTGYQLACRGVTRLTIIEREPICGYHSSGRNAAMIRQITSCPDITALACSSVKFFMQPPAGWETPLTFRQTGSLLLACGEGTAQLERDAADARSCGIPTERWSREHAVVHVPVLDTATFECAVWSPTDGVLDAHALLEGCLGGVRAAGGLVVTGAAVTGFRVGNRRIEAVETSRGLFPADSVVNAAGAWAGEIADMAGASTVPFRPCRRHLLSTGPIPEVNPDWPFVWDITHEFYFRPESGGLLFSPCDEVEFSPCDVSADPAAKLELAEKLMLYAPRLAEFPVVKTWAGLRTLTPDGRFVIGWDTKIENFMWVAGLGGHGVTTSPACGSLAARMIAGEEPESARPFAPRRFTEAE